MFACSERTTVLLYDALLAHKAKMFGMLLDNTESSCWWGRGDDLGLFYGHRTGNFAAFELTINFSVYPSIKVLNLEPAAKA